MNQINTVEQYQEIIKNENSLIILSSNHKTLILSSGLLICLLYTSDAADEILGV